MPELDWNEIDLAAARQVVRSCLDGAGSDERVVAHLRNGDAALVIARADASGVWGLLTISLDAGTSRREYAAQLIDLTNEHTILHGSAAEKRGEGPRVHYLVVRSLGVEAARVRYAGQEWRGVARDASWLLHVEATASFDTVPEFEYLEPTVGWSNL